ncbi:MAG: uracil-DNA glycosylase [Candidatus Izemoplasma sp.]|nr:uracil-DNA glycosylase [Candidatus Izemoplasma sp.]
MELPKDWRKRLETYTDLSYLDTIITVLNKAYQKNTIYPPKSDVFNALKECPFSDVKVVIIGQDPYHNKGQANGLAFSVHKGIKIPPSLKNIFKEMHNDLGIDIPQHGDLTTWARQGVLLLNAILTVEENAPLSHKNVGWQKLLIDIMSLLDQNDTPKVFVFWGNKAKVYKDYIHNPHHLVISSSHPSPLSARHSFFGSHVFSKINSFLKKNQRTPIDFSL